MCIRDRADIALDDIVSAKVMIGFNGYMPYRRLVIREREGFGEHEHILNLGLFDPEKIPDWMGALHERLPSLEK